MSDVHTASNPLVTRRDENSICRLTLNSPKTYNALSIECMEALIRELEILSADSSVNVVVIQGSGKGFCAGHNLKEMRENDNPEFYERTFSTCSTMMMMITGLPKPVIAKVHGVATAAGCQLVASCDLAVAEENARFGAPGVNIGLFCSTPMVALSRSISKKHAMEMLMSGDPISAKRACEIGLINRVVPIEELDRATNDLAAKIASKSPFALATGKRAFYEQISRDQKSAYEYCGRVMVESMMAEDAKEGIAAFMEKRAPVWRGK